MTNTLQFGSWRQILSSLVLGDKYSPVWFLETVNHQIGSWRQILSRLVLGDKNSPDKFLGDKYSQDNNGDYSMGMILYSKWKI